MAIADFYTLEKSWNIPKKEPRKAPPQANEFDAKASSLPAIRKC
jgi:hypothetical protein